MLNCNKKKMRVARQTGYGMIKKNGNRRLELNRVHRPCHSWLSINRFRVTLYQLWQTLNHFQAPVNHFWETLNEF